MNMKWVPNDVELTILGVIFLMLAAIMAPQSGGASLTPEGVRDSLPPSVRGRVEVGWRQAEWKGETDRQATQDLLNAYVKARNDLVWSEHQLGQAVGVLCLGAIGTACLLLALWRRDPRRPAG
jgi:hypothetical protein